MTEPRFAAIGCPYGTDPEEVQEGQFVLRVGTLRETRDTLILAKRKGWSYTAILPLSMVHNAEIPVSMIKLEAPA
jgi:hypothetical protein